MGIAAYRTRMVNDFSPNSPFRQAVIPGSAKPSRNKPKTDNTDLHQVSPTVTTVEEHLATINNRHHWTCQFVILPLHIESCVEERSNILSRYLRSSRTWVKFFRKKTATAYRPRTNITERQITKIFTGWLVTLFSSND